MHVNYFQLSLIGDCLFCQVYYYDGDNTEEEHQQQMEQEQQHHQQQQQGAEMDDISMITASSSITNDVTMDKAYKEPALISASKYPLLSAETAVSWCWGIHSNYVEVGLSQSLYFEAIVSVSCANTCCRMGKIIFTQKQWHAFMASRIEFLCRRFFDGWHTEPVTEEEHSLDVANSSAIRRNDNIKFIFRKVQNGNKTITIKDFFNHSIILSYDEFINLCSLTSLIVHKIEVLESQKFFDFYHTFVRIQSSLIKANPNTDIIFSAKMLCETVPSEHYYSIREMLTFFPDDFIADVKGQAEI